MEEVQRPVEWRVIGLASREREEPTFKGESGERLSARGSNLCEAWKPSIQEPGQCCVLQSGKEGGVVPSTRLVAQLGGLAHR